MLIGFNGWTSMSTGGIYDLNWIYLDNTCLKDYLKNNKANYPVCPNAPIQDGWGFTWRFWLVLGILCFLALVIYCTCWYCFLRMLHPEKSCWHALTKLCGYYDDILEGACKTICCCCFCFGRRRRTKIVDPIYPTPVSPPKPTIDRTEVVHDDRPLPVVYKTYNYRHWDRYNCDNPDNCDLHYVGHYPVYERPDHYPKYEHNDPSHHEVNNSTQYIDRSQDPVYHDRYKTTPYGEFK